MYFIFSCAVRLSRKQRGAGRGAVGVLWGVGSGQTIGGGLARVAVRPLVEGLASCVQ